MTDERPVKCTLDKMGLGSLFTYELTGEHIVGRFLALFPLVRIHLAAVYCLRLASQNETPPLFLLFNWIHFVPQLRRKTRPIYVLQTRSRYRIFLKLDSETHFRLRQAINRYAPQNTQPMAA